jgi:hypothetical protein
LLNVKLLLLSVVMLNQGVLSLAFIMLSIIVLNNLC